MFRILMMVMVLTALAPLAYAAMPACTNCPPLYCEDPAAAERALERKKNNARRQGVPERLIKLFDRTAKCVGCVETTPDGFTITWEIDEDAFEDDRGYAPGAQKRSMAWSADLEKKLRDDMRHGIVKEFHIVHYAGAPCTCCTDDNRESVREWGRLQSATGSKISGYDTNLEFHPDVAISYADPRKLGKDPKDLTTIPEAYRRGDTLKSPPLETFMDPVVRVVQVQCKDCQEKADQYNELGEEINDMREPIAKMRQDIHYSRQLIRDVWLEIEGIGKTAYTEGTDRKSKDLFDEIGGHQRALEKFQKRLSEKMAERAELELKLGAIMEGLKICEEQGCKPKADPVEGACALPTNHPAITIGANNEVGSGAQFENEMKDKAKGMAMGAIGGLLGGSGVSLGGGGNDDGGNAQQGPKLDKDPTSGKFTDVSSGGVDLEIRANVTDEGLVVSTNIDDTPGDGTFHAQWLQGADGTVYLPVRFLILELYRDWKLSVWWTHDKWVNGEHVYHDEGDSMTVGRDSLGTWKIFEGAKGIGKSIWNALGFKTAKKGVQHLGAVYHVPPSALNGPCPLQLVTHVSQPSEDPVTTTPVIGELFRQHEEKDGRSESTVLIRPAIMESEQ